MTKAIPKAWLCKHCGERVDPTMAFYWKCGHDREGHFVVELDEEESTPFLACPQCGYDLRGNPGARACPECGANLTLSGAQKDLYWVPSTTKMGAISKLFRNPLRMIPVASLAWLLFGILYLGGEDDFFPDYYGSGSIDGFTFFLFATATFFTFLIISGIMAQGLQPSDEEKTEASVTVGDGFIFRWLTRGWGRFVFWLAWGFLLLGILLF